MNDNTYTPPTLTILGDVEELTAGGQGTGDGTGSLKVQDSGPGDFNVAG